MGPGPSEIHPRVFSAMGRPTIGYLDPVFVEMMDELKELLRYAFQTKNELTFPVSGPGSAGSPRRRPATGPGCRPDGAARRQVPLGRGGEGKGGSA